MGDTFYGFGEFAVDGLVNGVAWLVKQSSAQLRRLQSGSIGFYVFAMVLSIVLMFALRFFISY